MKRHTNGPQRAEIKLKACAWEGYVNALCDDIDSLKAEVDRLATFRFHVLGHLADLERHVRVAAAERKFVPPGILSVVGALQRAAQAAE